MSNWNLHQFTVEYISSFWSNCVPPLYNSVGSYHVPLLFAHFRESFLNLFFTTSFHLIRGFTRSLLPVIFLLLLVSLFFHLLSICGQIILSSCFHYTIRFTDKCFIRRRMFSFLHCKLGQVFLQALFFLLYRS